MNGIIHRDLKPQNILLDKEGFIKIADFGTSDFIGSEQKITSCVGTYYFMAPELLNIKKYPDSDPFKSDIWSLGVTILPFLGNNLVDLFENIQNQKVTFPKYLSKGFQILVNKLLTKNPDQRIQLNDIIKDPWINQDCTELQCVMQNFYNRDQLYTVTITDEDLKKAITIDFCVQMKKMGVFMKKPTNYKSMKTIKQDNESSFILNKTIEDENLYKANN